MFSQRCHQADWLSCVLWCVHQNQPCLAQAIPGLLSEATTAAPLLPETCHPHSTQLSKTAGLEITFQHEGIY